MTTTLAFGSLPAGLRDSLIKEYQLLVQSFLEGRWTPTELSGGKFCEIVHTIIDGYGSAAYQAKPKKPNSMVDACRALEARKNVPRSFQILIPRILPALYEIRNNRGVGHAGGDVDPNHMDATAVLAMVNWVMAELVRVLHDLPTTEEAQILVDNLAIRRIPLIWEQDGMKRVLNTSFALPDQVLLLTASSATSITETDLVKWTDAKNKTYLRQLLKRLHESRQIDLSESGTTITILPPGTLRVEELIRQHMGGQSSAKPTAKRKRKRP